MSATEKRCFRCGCLRNTAKPDAGCVMGCDDDDGAIYYDATTLREVRNVHLPPEDCDVCGEPIDDDGPRCEHGRQVCPLHLAACSACRRELADDHKRWGE